ncbi:hypothetical protein LSH36_120g13011 [Paralvinella palmiformis]|uniref:Uncharacterized protein n=1 Tax=Paralvinella palmiformis TaxID=53620 RepID=A0AAD9NBJ4_9ANNE|nr:hypothetical protein LSH36_120g13011 [Paralvinella palmiformis]
MDEYSRRSSRAISVDSRRRQSMAVGTSLHGSDIERRKSTKSDACVGDDKPQFELPGIQISRIETLDLGDAGSILSGSGRSSKRYIIIHSDMSSDFSRLSCPSDYSLAGSRSSKSRSSRASSGVSSRLWDFSPRESEWDADISLGSRESQLNVSKQDWAGGPSDYGRDDYLMSRKMSVVTFDVGDVGEPFRRHSSPAYAMHGRDACAECICGRIEPAPPCGVLKQQQPQQHKDASCSSILRYYDENRKPSAVSSYRKKSEASILSLRIEEDDGDDVDENTPLTAPPEGAEATGTSTGAPPGKPEEKAKTQRSRVRTDRPPLTRHNTEPLRLTGSEDEYVGIPSTTSSRRESGTLRPPLRRNNTDDSEVERRVARLFKEIEFSVSDSVDESRINSQEYEGSSVRRVEAETQTISEDELTAALAASLKAESGSRSADVRNIKFPTTKPVGRHDSTGSYSDNLRESFDSADVNIDRPQRTKKTREKFKLSAISSALANLGKRASLEKRSMKPKNIPKLFQGFSDDKPSDGGATEKSGSKSTNIKSTPPTYEDVVNDNL